MVLLSSRLPQPLFGSLSRGSDPELALLISTRREGITRFIERGLNLIEASAISGHRDLRMLKRYVVPSQTTLLAKLDRTETALKSF
jgi:hypothetical protein